MQINALIGKDQVRSHKAVLNTQQDLVSVHLFKEKEAIRNQLKQDDLDIVARKQNMNASEFRHEFKSHQQKKNRLLKL